VRTVQGGVQHGGSCVYCDSTKTVLEEIQQAPESYAIICMVQKFELTGSICNNKKGVVGRYRSAHVQDNVAHTHEMLQSVSKGLLDQSLWRAP
jgi:hypothetical protein